MMMRLSLLALCCSLSLPMTAVVADETSTPQETLRSHMPDVFALTGAKVVVSPERTIDEATIVIRNGRITDVGPGLAVPADAREISLKGRTVYAGFIDAYSEHTIPTDKLMGGSRYWNAQVTPQLSVAETMPSALDYGALRKQGITAQLIAPADGVVRGSSALVLTSDVSLNETLLVRDVAQHLLLTAPRRSRTGYPGSPMGAVALARQAILDAQWYGEAGKAVAADPTLPPVEVNDALAALQPVLNGSMPIMVTASNEQFVLRADQYASEFGLSLIVVGSGREYRRIEEIAALRRPMILPLAFPKAPQVNTPEAAMDVTLEDLLHWDIAPENPARVDAAGIPFALTTEKLTNKSDFLKSLRKAVARGLSATSALRALTVTPADMYGVRSQLGTVEPGRLANLVVTDGDLFADKTSVVETWIAGKRFEHSTEPLRDVEGHYELQLSASGTMPTRLYAEFQESDGKLSGRISRDPIPRRSKSSDRSSAPSGDKSAEGNSEESKKSPEAPAQSILSLKSVRLSDTLLSAQFDGKDWGMEGTIRLSLTLAESTQTTERPQGIGHVVWTDGTTSSTIASRTTPPDPAIAEAAQQPTSTPDGQPGENKSSAETAAAEPPGDQKSQATPPKAQASFGVNYPLGSFGRSTMPVESGPTAFVHATIWTCGPEGILNDATLLIDKGRIVAVGKQVEIPQGATIIDVQGMHLTPGIIDCHSHAATDGGVNEGTQAITCEVRIGDFVDANDITIYRQLAGGVTCANVLHGSANPIGGQNQVIKFRWGLTGEGLKFREAPQGVKFALGENVKQSNWTDSNGRYPQTRMGVEQVYRDAFEAARDYAKRMEAWKTDRRGLPPRRDLELEALQEVLEGRRWIHCHSYRQDEILAFLNVLRDYNVTVGTLQHILEGYKIADELAKHGAMASAFSDWWAYKFEVYDAIPYAGAMMHQQGVVVSFNSDDGELARHLNQEAAKAIKYGNVPREEALKFVTLNPARQLRIDHLVGSLEPGKHADFVIWNGDPLSNFTRCEQTWIDGRAWFRRAEDEQLRQQAQHQRNVLIQKVLNSGEEMVSPRDRQREPSELWPRFDEYCSHVRHEAAQLLQKQIEQQQQE